MTFSSQRTRRWPDVPTRDELGYKTVSDSPFGLAGPAGTEPSVVNVLHHAFRNALDVTQAIKIGGQRRGEHRGLRKSLLPP